MAPCTLFYWQKQVTLPDSNEEAGRCIPPTVREHCEVHGKEHGCRKNKDLGSVM